VYLARFDLPEGAVAQGLVALRGLPPPSAAASAWREDYVRLVQSIDIGPFAVGRRLVAVPDAGLSQALFVAAEERRSAELRRVLASFTRLETTVPGVAGLPLTRGEYDAVADDFPRVRCRVGVSGFSVDGTWLACDFRVAPFLGELAAEAAAYGYRLGYHVNLRSADVPRDVLRAVRTNALEVNRLVGAPVAVAELQHRLAERIGHAVAVCEEYTAVDAGEPEAWVDQALTRHFRAGFGAMRFETPTWELVEDGYEDELACPLLPPATEPQLDEIAAAAVDRADVEALVAWWPPPSLERPLVALPPDPGPEPVGVWVAPADLPAAYEGEEPYLFISYKRSDLVRIAATLRAVEAAGQRFWYDRGIPGGSDWNAVLEERLASSEGLLLFLSQPAVESKYVRREILFADTLDKPILVVQIEQAELRYGLRMLLEQFQMLNVDAPDFPEQLARALAHARTVAAASTT
jgi:hypothetical protein